LPDTGVFLAAAIYSTVRSALQCQSLPRRGTSRLLLCLFHHAVFRELFKFTAYVISGMIVYSASLRAHNV